MHVCYLCYYSLPLNQRYLRNEILLLRIFISYINGYNYGNFLGNFARKYYQISQSHGLWYWTNLTSISVAWQPSVGIMNFASCLAVLSWMLANQGSAQLLDQNCAEVSRLSNDIIFSRPWMALVLLPNKTCSGALIHKCLYINVDEI